MTSSKQLLLLAISVLISALLIHNFFNQPSSNTQTSSSAVRLLQGMDELVPIAGAVGPESFAFDPAGEGPYTGVSDGRIIKWNDEKKQWTDFAFTSQEREFCQRSKNHDLTEEICGRPLGLCFSEQTGELYIADAYMGLLILGPNGGLATKVVTHVQDAPLRFTNGVDIDQRTGVVYFTDSSTQYQRRTYVAATLTGDRTGRLLKYDPQTKQVTVLLDRLAVANGVALSKNGDFILVVESALCRILRYWIKTSRAGTSEVFANLTGFPDNIKRNSRGEFWVGFYSRKSRLSHFVISHHWAGKAVNVVLTLLPTEGMKKKLISYSKRGGGAAVKLNEEGDVLEELGNSSGAILPSISEVLENDGKLWVGSVETPFAGVYRYREHDDEKYSEE